MGNQNICNRCILPSNYPCISYNDSGVCNYCLDWDLKWKNAKFMNENADFSKVANLVRDEKKVYDCVIGLSGGKDSCYVAYVIVTMGLRPIAVTFDNGFLSESALSNIEATITHLSLPHIMIKPSRDSMMKWYKHTLLKTGDFCAVCNVGIRAALYRTARNYGIKWIVSGTSPRTEANSPIDWFACSEGYLRNVTKDEFTKEEIDAFAFVSDFQRIWWHVSSKIRFLQLPRYMSWDEENMLKVIKDKLGWKGNLWEEHTDCLMSNAKEYLRWKKFGVSEKTAKLSALVSDGQIGREKAFEMKEKHECEIASKESLTRELITRTLGVSEDELNRALGTDHVRYVPKKDRVIKNLRNLFYK